jgi:hypothetical protein
MAVVSYRRDRCRQYGRNARFHPTFSLLPGSYTFSIEFTGANERVNISEDARLITGVFLSELGEGKVLLSYLGTVVMQWMLLAMYVRD